MRRTVRVVLVALAVASVVLVARELPSPAAVWHEVGRADLRWLAVIVVAEILSVNSFARLQRRLLAGGGVRISLRKAFAVTYAGNAISATLPAGPAMSLAYAFRQWRGSGASQQLAGAVVLIGGAATTVSYTVVSSVALLAEPRSRTVALAVLAGTAALGALAVVAARRRALDALLARTRAHPRLGPWITRLDQGRASLGLSGRDWTAVAALACTVWVGDIVGVVGAVHAVGLDLSPTQAALAYITAQAAGTVLPLLPGGLGAMEASMAAAMVGFGAVAAAAGAAVLLYRLVAFWGVAGAGWLAWAALRFQRPAGVLRS